MLSIDEAASTQGARDKAEIAVELASTSEIPAMRTMAAAVHRLAAVVDELTEKVERLTDAVER